MDATPRFPIGGDVVGTAPDRDTLSAMSPRCLIVGAPWIVAALAASGCAPTTTELEAQARPHVVIWLVDTLRADHLGCYGYERPTSPHLDALARNGVRFANLHVHANWTMPSVASLLSGMAPDIYPESWTTRVPDDLALAAERFGEGGYETAGFTATVATAAFFGFDQGYDTYVELDGELSLSERKMRAGRAFDADTLVEAGLEWLDARDDERPFFLTLHSIDPHAPYAPPAEFDRWTKSYDGTIDGSVASLRGLAARDITPRDRAHLLALYDGEVAFNDHALGMLVAGLEARGIAEQTLLVVVSDHGEEFGDRGGYGHAHRNLHRELTHVPWVLHWPVGLAPDVVVEQLVGGMDVLPTLLDACGFEVDGMDGRSVLDLVRGTSMSPADVYAFRAKQPGDIAAVRTDTHLYHWDERGQRTGLFDLAADTDEHRDMRTGAPALATQLDTRLTTWLGERAARRRPPAATPDGATREALIDLGYLEDGSTKTRR